MVTRASNQTLHPCVYGSGGVSLCPPKHGADWQGKGGERPGKQAAVCHAAEDRQSGGGEMNGIILDDKLYKFVPTGEEVDCDECDLMEVCSASVICRSMRNLTDGGKGCEVFKELQIEK